MTREQRIFVLLWGAFLLLVGCVATAYLVNVGRRELAEARERHTEVMSSVATPGETDPERAPPPGHENDVARTVRVGVYVDRIPELSILNSSWKADFYVWFNWEGPDLDPGETFQVVNAELASKTLLKKRDTGNSHYALYRATAEITKSFNVARFPRDDHMLTIAIEDSAKESYQLVYVPDAESSTVSSRVAVSGYRVLETGSTVKPHAYKTSRGDPALPQGYHATYSQFRFGIWIGRASWAFYVKMFVILFVGVLIALIGLFVRGPSERLGCTTAALFVVCCNFFTTASGIPDTGVATLADHINAIGCVTAGFVVLETVIYQHYYVHVPGREGAALVFDRVSFVVMSGLYLLMNIVIPLAASAT